MGKKLRYEFTFPEGYTLQHPNLHEGKPLHIGPTDSLRFDDISHPGYWACIEKAMRENHVFRDSIVPMHPKPRRTLWNSIFHN